MNFNRRNIIIPNAGKFKLISNATKIQMKLNLKLLQIPSSK